MGMVSALVPRTAQRNWVLRMKILSMSPWNKLVDMHDSAMVLKDALHSEAERGDDVWGLPWDTHGAWMPRVEQCVTCHLGMGVIYPIRVPFPLAILLPLLRIFGSHQIALP